jgi:hypothetical protein
MNKVIAILFHLQAATRCPVLRWLAVSISGEMKRGAGRDASIYSKLPTDKHILTWPVTDIFDEPNLLLVNFISFCFSLMELEPTVYFFWNEGTHGLRTSSWFKWMPCVPMSTYVVVFSLIFHNIYFSFLIFHTCTTHPVSRLAIFSLFRNTVQI